MIRALEGGVMGLLSMGGCKMVCGKIDGVIGCGVVGGGGPKGVFDVCGGEAVGCNKL